MNAAVTDAATYANRLTAAGSTTDRHLRQLLTCDEQAEAALGCTDDDATNYSATAIADDGCDCLYNVTCRLRLRRQPVCNDGDIAYVNGSFKWLVRRLQSAR